MNTGGPKETNERFVVTTTVATPTDAPVVAEAPKRSTYHTSTAAMADALQRVVDDLRAAGDQTVTSSLLCLVLQPSTAEPDAVRHAVRTFAAALVEGETEDAVMFDGSVFHRIGYRSEVSRRDIKVQSYGVVQSAPAEDGAK